MPTDRYEHEWTAVGIIDRCRHCRCRREEVPYNEECHILLRAAFDASEQARGRLANAWEDAHDGDEAWDLDTEVFEPGDRAAAKKYRQRRSSHDS